MAAAFFSSSASTVESLACWTAEYWLGDSKALLTPDRNLGVEDASLVADTDAGTIESGTDGGALTDAGSTDSVASSADTLYDKVALLDRLCICGLEPIEALDVVEKHAHLVEAEGVLSFILARYRDNLLMSSTKRNSPPPKGIGFALWRSYDAWRHAHKDESLEAGDVAEWLENYLAGLPSQRAHTRSTHFSTGVNQLTDAQPTTTIPGPASAKGQVLLIGVPRASESWSPKELGDFLHDAGLHGPSGGRKRWFHGCHGQRADSILSSGIANTATTGTHDLSREPGLYLHEYFSLADKHARQRTVAAALPPAHASPCVLIFDLLEETMMKQDHEILDDMAEAQRLLFASRNRNGPTSDDPSRKLLLPSDESANSRERAPSRRRGEAAVATQDSSEDTIAHHVKLFRDGPNRGVPPFAAGKEVPELRALMKATADARKDKVWLFGPTRQNHTWSIPRMTLHSLSQRDLNMWLEVLSESDEELKSEQQGKDGAAAADAVPRVSQAQALGLVVDPQHCWARTRMRGLSADNGPTYTGQLMFHVEVDQASNMLEQNLVAILVMRDVALPNEGQDCQRSK